MTRPQDAISYMYWRAPENGNAWKGWKNKRKPDPRSGCAQKANASRNRNTLHDTFAILRAEKIRWEQMYGFMTRRWKRRVAQVWKMWERIRDSEMTSGEFVYSELEVTACSENGAQLRQLCTCKFIGQVLFKGYGLFTSYIVRWESVSTFAFYNLLSRAVT